MPAWYDLGLFVKVAPLIEIGNKYGNIFTRSQSIK